MTVHELHHKDAHYSFHIRKGGKKEGRKRLTTGLTQRAEQVRRVEISPCGVSTTPSYSEPIAARVCMRLSNRLCLGPTG